MLRAARIAAVGSRRGFGLARARPTLSLHAGTRRTYSAWYSSPKTTESPSSMSSNASSKGENISNPVSDTSVDDMISVVDEIVVEDDDALIARRFCDQIASQSEITNLSAWYTFKFSHLIDQVHGCSRLKQYQPHSILQMAYPNHAWHPWLFPVTPRGFWRSPENRRRYFDWLKEDLGIGSDWRGWYRVSGEDVRSNHGANLLRYFNDSAPLAIMDSYPEYSWEPWKFESQSLRIWDQPETAAQFFKSIEKDLRINTMDDWYSIDAAEVIQRGGMLLVGRKFKRVLSDALQFAFPDHPWQLWRFRELPKHQWGDKSVQRKFISNLLSSVSQKRGITESLTNLYDITTVEAREAGAAFLRFYSSSWPDAVMALFPEHNWSLLEFADFKRPIGGFSSQRRSLGLADLSAKSVVDSVDSLLDSIGSELMSKDATEEQPKDAEVPTGASLLRQFAADAAKVLHVESLDDWYGVPMAQIQKLPGKAMERFRHVLSSAGNLPILLKRAYPEHEWNASLFGFKVSKKRLMERLEIVLDVVFPFVPRKTNHTFRGASDDGSSIVLDVYYPAFNLAFRCATGRGGSFEQTQELCSKAGIALVIVPAGWDMMPESLREMIQAVKPESFAAAAAFGAPKTPPIDQAASSESSQ